MFEEIVYKIMEAHRGEYKTLFYGINYCRILPFNTWLKAELRYVRDGSNSVPYISGIHCFKDKKIAEKYLRRFRTERDRVIVKCLAKGLRTKPSNPDVFLADEIFIPSQKC